MTAHVVYLCDLQKITEPIVLSRYLGYGSYALAQAHVIAADKKMKLGSMPYEATIVSAEVPESEP
jgi:hypothetical protein